MKITPLQRTTLMKIWGRVCKERGWKTSDREFRLAKWSEIIGRQIASADDIGRIDECTKLMHELKALLGDDLQAGLEANDLTINKARVLRNQILTELVPCLELYIEDVRAYMTDIMADKNRWWKIDRPTREITVLDLTAEPIQKFDVRTKRMKNWPSQLEQLQYTLAARLNTLRNKAGQTIHQMKTAAGVPCNCMKCQRRELVQQEVTAGEVPDDAISPEQAAEDAWWEQEAMKEAEADEKERSSVEGESPF